MNFSCLQMVSSHYEFRAIWLTLGSFASSLIDSTTLLAGKFQTEIGKSWAAEVISRRKSTLADKGN